jgi:hypothetical protein
MRTSPIVLSVLLVAVILVGLFFVFYSISSTPPPPTGTPVASSTTPATATFRSAAAGFTLEYPSAYAIQEEVPASTTDWQVVNQDQTMGIKIVTLTIPKEFEPQTNFSEGQLRMGISRDSKAVSTCLAPTGANSEIRVEQNINGVTFVGYKTGDAGAGNFYDTTSFRTIHGGTCYVVDLVVHYTNLQNWPAELHLHEFNHARVYNALHDIFATFKFI